MGEEPDTLRGNAHVTDGRTEAAHDTGRVPFGRVIKIVRRRTANKGTGVNPLRADPIAGHAVGAAAGFRIELDQGFFCRLKIVKRIGGAGSDRLRSKSERHPLLHQRLTGQTGLDRGIIADPIRKDAGAATAAEAADAFDGALTSIPESLDRGNTWRNLQGLIVNGYQNHRTLPLIPFKSRIGSRDNNRRIPIVHKERMRKCSLRQRHRQFGRQFTI
jgi:hypothetical protein